MTKHWASKILKWTEWGIRSFSKSVPAGLAGTAGVYCAQCRCIRCGGNTHWSDDFSLLTIARRLKGSKDFYPFMFGLSCFFHMAHRSSVYDHEQTIRNPNNSVAYRRLVRVVTFPFRMAITQPLLTIPLYFSLGYCLMAVSAGMVLLQDPVMGPHVLSQMSDDNNKHHKQGSPDQQETKETKRETLFTWIMANFVRM